MTESLFSGAQPEIDPASAADAAVLAGSTPMLEAALERWAQNAFQDEPFTKLVALVGLGAALFYKAELGTNPKVKTYWDALVYVSTCASVGYGDIFAQTSIGKAIGSFVMTVGPAMANAAFAGGQVQKQLEAKAQDAKQAEMLEVMKQILEELRKKNA
jgi:voltage-gated potassium channel